MVCPKEEVSGKSMGFYSYVGKEIAAKIVSPDIRCIYSITYYYTLLFLMVLLFGHPVRGRGQHEMCFCSIKCISYATVFDKGLLSF